jgi:hypothetical protein
MDGFSQSNGMKFLAAQQVSEADLLIESRFEGWFRF